jgi:hypothetical protein
MKRIPFLAFLLAAACSSGVEQKFPDQNPELRAMLTAADDAVFVGDRTRLTAVFDEGEAGSIDGIGPVDSGVPVQTPPLSRTTTFTLRVSRGEEHAEARATVQASYRNVFRALHAAPIAQTGHVAAVLPAGGAIMMGGYTSVSLSVPDSSLTQIFDPRTETFTAGPDLLFTALAQDSTLAAQLGNGAFLLVGGGPNAGAGARTSVVTQLFDPATGRLTAAGDAASRELSRRTISALGDGGALLTGGTGGVALVSDAVERFDPAEAKWRAAGHMLHVRAAHTATLLRDGRVLIAGGLSCCHALPAPFFFASSAEIYDPATGGLTATGSMHDERGLHAAALLPDGRVLITGGEGNDPAAPPIGTEIFDPATGEFSPAGDLLAPRDSHSAVALTDGRVLLVGGEVPPTVAGRVGVAIEASEIFDPATGRWSEGPRLEPAFFEATVTMLASGKVLVFGGQDLGGSPRADAAVFE